MATEPNASNAGDDPSDTSDPKLADELRAYKEAYEQEFAEPDIISLKHKTQKLLVEAVPAAVNRLIYLIDHAEKDSTQLAASKYVIDAVLGKGGGAAMVAEDPVEALLQKLAANDVEDS